MSTLYLDCDGFFACCEQAGDSALHGRPVGVSTANPARPGSVLIAVNPLAKHLGARKGMAVTEARRLAPDLAVRAQRPELYVATHHAIARAVDTVLPRAKSRSIDELSADLAPSDHPEKILEDVKTAIRQAVGPIVTVSCGIAGSSYLAKTAAEANKPDAAVVWRPGDIPEVYDCLDLDDLPGLGPATEARLRRRNIDTVAKIYHAQRAVAQWAWGSTIGRDVHKALHGKPWNPRRKPRQRLSHGRVLEPEVRSWDAARPIARFLVTVTLHRCAYEQLAPGRLILEVLGEQGRGWTAGADVEPTNDEPAALKAITCLWDAIGHKARDVPFKIGLTATKLNEWPPRQFELFERKENRVQGLLHTVRDRFGAKAITVGDSLDRTGPYTGFEDQLRAHPRHRNLPVARGRASHDRPTLSGRRDAKRASSIEWIQLRGRHKKAECVTCSDGGDGDGKSRRTSRKHSESLPQGRFLWCRSGSRRRCWKSEKKPNGSTSRSSTKREVTIT